MDGERLPEAPLYADVRDYCSHVNLHCKDGTSVFLSSMTPSFHPKLPMLRSYVVKLVLYGTCSSSKEKQLRRKRQQKEYNSTLSTFILGLHVIFCLIAVPPSIQSIQNETLIEGSSRNLTCDASGIPSPTVAWIEEGSGPSTPGNVLRLIDIYRNRSGEYRCEASNRCGNKSVTTFVHVHCK